MPTPAPPACLFGPFKLDAAAATLTRHGVPVALRPKTFALLLLLVQRAGQLVSKDDMLDLVWGRRFVTEGVIKTAISELRAALGDDPQQSRWISTVARRGYRFTAPRPASQPHPASGAAAPSGGELHRRPSALASKRELLESTQQLVFTSPSAVDGGFALKAAQAACNDAMVSSSRVMDALDMLVEKSLAAASYRAAGDTKAGSEARLLRQRHLQTTLQLWRHAEAHALSDPMVPWPAPEGPDTDTAARDLMVHAVQLWLSAGLVAEGLRACERARARACSSRKQPQERRRRVANDRGPQTGRFRDDSGGSGA